MPDEDGYDWVYDDGLLVAFGYRFVLLPASEAHLLLQPHESTRSLQPDQVEAFLWNGEVVPVATAQLNGSWTLLLDPFFRLVRLADPAVTPPLRGRVVSLWSNVNAHSEFAWWDDGVLQLAFKYSSVSWERRGVQAEASRPLLAEVGFDLRDDENDEALLEEVQSSNDDRRAFALAERLTGVSLQPNLLAALTYRGAVLAKKLVGAVSPTRSCRCDLPDVRRLLARRLPEPGRQLSRSVPALAAAACRPRSSPVRRGAEGWPVPAAGQSAPRSAAPPPWATSCPRVR